MYKRLELHNHTTESDSSLTPKELMEFMVQDKVDAFALTDHNTISGHTKMKALLQTGEYPISCIYGMEYTTYYGHILCLNLKEYVPWENINLHKPELLFTAAKEKGALVGVAHPFSYGHPFARGCRFDMKINDYSCVDFIEVFNNPEPLHEVNERGLLLWEELVLQGHPLACTCGMDLHGKWDMAGQYATFVEGTEDGSTEEELATAINAQRTWVSKGPILEAVRHEDTLTFTVRGTGKPGFLHTEDIPYVLQLRTKKGALTETISEQAPFTLSCSEFEGETLILPKLYKADTQIEHLITIAPTIRL